MLTEKDKQFAAEFLEKVAKKISIMAPQIGANFPWTDGTTGEWLPHGERFSITNWTAGYWPGIMWLMYIKTGDEMYRKFAEECEEKMDVCFFERFTELHHDVGFMWSLTSVANYKITGSEMARKRALWAANYLAARYNPNTGTIRAWPRTWCGPYYAIVDCMLNIPLLEWAARYSIEPDVRFSNIARAHADRVIETFIRPDGSSNHIVEYDPETGEVLSTPAGQGYASGSSWSRGQSWALYGFILAYLNSGKQEYLDTAKRVAHYFIANVEHGKLPLLDFRAPREPVYYDASAAAIAACGLLEIAKVVPDYESDMYDRTAIEFLRTLEKDCNFNEDELVLLNTSSGSYDNKKSIHRPYNFADYYLMEALMKIYGNDGKFVIHGEE